jgi:chorismate synthase
MKEWSDWAERAAWTFAQAFLAIFAVEGGDIGQSFKAATVAGVAAVLSVAKTAVKNRG